MNAFSIRSLLAGAAMLVATAAQAATTLTLSTPDPDGAEITVAANKFAELVAAKTNGEVTIKVFPNGTLYGGDPSGAVKQLAGGSLDILVLATSLYANFNPKFSAISIPYLFDDEKQLRAYLAGEHGQELIADLNAIGIKGLSLWTRPFRQMTNSKLPIEKPADLAGLKFRVPNNPLWVEFFKKMGAAPTPMAFAEVYNALQLKVVDGQENPISVPLAAKFYEVQSFVSITNHMADGWVLGINPAKFDALSEAEKAAVTEAAEEAEAWKAENDAAQAETILKDLEGHGMKVNRLTPEQQAAFVAVSKQLFPVFAGLVKDQTFFDKSLAFVGKK
ncbi:DctP family TRAP transporter solute-binding subunit [Mesorhizobium sp.]|uniref:DctP family TRAP transporter solute-binding subunit n=1 Tax=Mesorhizobium sp. TaxID=1871066 RepID=UPI000FEA413C|nr:DctP family TRAP transporter solute-binding subunit [Mesorhizobium sp.]RWK60921.1 MAG: DctP family TRAP transporter solute-binding subunit [Mesorhizobium sp.]RWM46525.1 MAG: DctP family TRAP transporter solute-binding subunit [Mesorhizobium sp.]RWM50430.1 MAG: DctP family TRAP transporter solute-binding subunit [Mesorhizobium sp.]RWM55505.1 MAG: DctP family TRAP transporter solute-binding subunit [Mesorhizobium sp.]RWM95910.1 MAG: DctP family TRAP transporter solute-binding subunit [Mesorhi